MVTIQRIVFTLSDDIQMPASLFKLTWMILSIVILCVIAMVLYGILNGIEKHYLRHI
jgi:hypothetical protein